MVRNRKPTRRNAVSDAVIRNAVDSVMNKEMSLRQASEMNGISKSRLARAVIKSKNAAKDGLSISTFQPQHHHRMVFNTNQEDMLMSYILEASKIHQGMTKKSVRRFAYEYAKHLKLSYPDSWDPNETAGR